MKNKESEITIEEFGKQFMRGALDELIRVAFCFMLLFILVILIANTFGIGTDSSDASGWDRSGLRIHTDALTGVQYLSDRKGGMCIRVMPEKKAKP